jgi:RNA polymerase sigma factor, sigma-70 family
MDYRDYSDSELIYYVRENNEDANMIIFNKYEPLIAKIAKKMHVYVKYNGIEVQDLMQEGRLGLNSAIYNFNENKDNLFYTFAKTCIERRMISLIVASRRQKHRILNESLSLEFAEEDGVIGNLEAVLSDKTENPEEKLFVYEREKELVSKIKELLTDNELAVFDLKLSGLNYKEIAEVLDKTPKSVDNTIQRIKNKFKDMIKEEISIEKANDSLT